MAMVVTMGLTGVSIAAAAGGAVHAWSTSKSERMLETRATVQLPAPERATLERELRHSVLQYSALSYAAIEVGDAKASLTFDRIAAEYRQALRAVIGGIDIADADCLGTGRALAAQRFRTFDCLVESGVLQIPTTELDDAVDDALPSIVQREPRHLGPIVTWVQVRVTGSSSFTYE